MNKNSEHKAHVTPGKIALYIFYGLLSIGLLVLVLNMNDLGQIFYELGRAQVGYILIAIGLLFAYLALYPITLVILSKAEKVECKSKEIYYIGMTEHFFNGITPFATGGQPFEIYAMSRNNIKPSKSTGIMMMNFVIFMITTNLFALLSLIYFSRFATSTNIYVISIIGFTINFLVIFFIIALATSKHLASFIVRIMKWFGRFKFLNKAVEKNLPLFEGYVNQTQAAFKALLHHKKTFVICFFIRILTMFIYYAISFFVLKAIGVSVGYDQLFFIVSATSFAITAVVFLPTPGSAGGIEFAFTTIFQNALLISAVESASGMLLWRLITFYLTLLISFIFYIVVEVRIKMRKKKLLQIQQEESNNDSSHL